MIKKLSLLLLLVFLAVACNSIKPYYRGKDAAWQNHEPDSASKPVFSLYLIGDAGLPSLVKQEPVLKLLQQHLEQTPNSGVVYLGDNIYQRGLPPIDDPKRKEAEKYFTEQLKILKNYAGKVFIIPGNHDWNAWGVGGLAAINRQEQFAEKYLKRGNIFLPDSGCPGPVEVPLLDNLTLLVVDTQWWLHQHDKPQGENSYCEVRDEADFILQLQDAIKRNEGKNIVVVGHHPIISNSLHGGHFPLNDHLFPLINGQRWLYFPLPLIGSIYPLDRAWFGHIQDISHPKYKALRNSMFEVFGETPLVYASGHDHNLQMHKHQQQYHIVSGSGSKISHVARGYDAVFTYQNKGFAVLRYYEGGEAWAEFYTPVGDGSTGKLMFRKKIRDAMPVKEPIVAGQTFPDYSDSTMVMAPGENYAAGTFKRALLGNHYREEWLTRVQVPYFDMGRLGGGLTPYKRGGGMQTKSLRFRAEDGHEYVIRTIQKDPSKTLPENLRRTIVAEVEQDQISSSHPFAAFVIPKMADAVEVYHTMPRMMYVPDDPRLGEFREDFKNQLVLFEERPTGAISNPDFDNTKKIVNTEDVIKKLLDDNDNRVDQAWVVRSRLFDMLIGDWDRHEDQWRWATFKIKDGGQLYRPIPRDRDQAFFKFDGILPWLASRQWALRKMQDFDYRIRDVSGFNFNARYFDRSFTTELSLEDWLKEAERIKLQLTDSVIRDAIDDLPPQVFQHSGESIIAKLRARRDLLPEIAREHYLFLSKRVNVPGTNKHEFFDVERKDNGQTEVTVYKINKERERTKVIYHRVFKNDETKEIRLFGMDGDDVFTVRGKADNGIKIRVVGGTDKDSITDESSVAGLRRKTLVYDRKKNTYLNLGSESRNHTSDRDSLVNEYNRTEFKYNLLMPLLYPGYNLDDGLFLGGGFLYRRHSFRKYPYAYTQSLVGNYALATGSFNFLYKGHFTDVIGKWDVNLLGRINAPVAVTNYYGLGNETVNHVLKGNLDYNRVRYHQYTFRPSLMRRFAGVTQWDIGLQAQSTRVERTEGRFISEPASELTADDFKWKHYGSVLTSFRADNTDSETNPRRGFRFNSLVGYHQNLEGKKAFAEFASDLSVYLSLPIILNPTLALRIGGAHNAGSFEFFQAHMLGQSENLRGFRRSRFGGKSSIYQNTELRIKLASFQTYIVPGSLGLLFLSDHGRVWMPGEESDRWHHSIGGGVWISPVDKAVINATYTYSREMGLLNVRVGFLF